MRFHEFQKAQGSTLAVRTINRYADEVGKDSMDYEMFKKSADLLDRQMLKSLAQHIEDSDTAPREYVMKKIADHDPETFKKMYGDQEGYLSLMKPMKNLTDGEIKEDEGNMDLIGDGAENLGLDPNKFDYYYDTSGAGYGEVRTKSGRAILQFEYDRDGDAEVSTMDNKTIANIKQGEQLPNNVTAKLNMIKEGASFYGYYKDPKDPEGRTMTYPDDMEFKTPHRSNAAARMLLSRIGLDPDFENTGSTPIDDFIAATDKYLRMNVSDKDNPDYDEVEVYDQEARRIKKTHPEVTHVGFN